MSRYEGVGPSVNDSGLRLEGLTWRAAHQPHDPPRCPQTTQDGMRVTAKRYVADAGALVRSKDRHVPVACHGHEACADQLPKHRISGTPLSRALSEPARHRTARAPTCLHPVAIV